MPYTATLNDLPELAPAAAITALLQRHRSVYIPDLPVILRLEAPIVMDSGMTLSIHPQTVLRATEASGGCMLRNRNLYSGCDGSIHPDLSRDSHILVEGGQWEPVADGHISSDRSPIMADFSRRHLLLGAIFFCHAQNITVRNLTLRHGLPYGVLLADVNDFTVSHIHFDDYKKDGVHVNGPAARGVIEDLSGHCGDDLAALNAWDWDTSAVSFGPITHITLRRLACERDELRLLPGMKRYPDGSTVDCPIAHCRLEDIAGVYSFKLYQQPNCHNKELNKHDASVTPGLLQDITFARVSLPTLTPGGLAEVQLKGVFEIGADAEGLVFEDMDFDFPASALQRHGMTLVDAGPRSSTWTRGFTDPAMWSELFEPDLICHARGLTFKNIRFGSTPCTDPDILVRARHLTVNPDYPRTTPQGGTGYGVVEDVKIL